MMLTIYKNPKQSSLAKTTLGNAPDFGTPDSKLIFDIFIQNTQDMVAVLEILFCIGLLIVFFYFSYRHDYRRNPKAFKRTILGMPMSLLSLMNGIPFISDWVGKWIRDAEKDNYE
jgi:hypothetical protein